MVESEEIRRNFRSLIGLIGGGGILTLIGLSLPYFKISRPELEEPVFLDGFEIPIIESILQLVGCMLAVTAGCMIFFYFRKLNENNIEKTSIEKGSNNSVEKVIIEKKSKNGFERIFDNDIDKKFENVMVVTIMSLLFSFIGLGVTIFDFINAIILATERGVVNPVSVEIGFFISIIGPVVTFLGLATEIKVVRA